jgi:hypothetical protein
MGDLGNGGSILGKGIQIGSGATKTRNQLVLGTLSAGVKRSGREADNSYSYCITCIVPCAVFVCMCCFVRCMCFYLWMYVCLYSLPPGTSPIAVNNKYI